MVVATIVTLLLFVGGPNGAVSFAQQQTTSPPGPTIEWLNPDNDTSNEISTKDDTPGDQTTTSYHLVATVSQLPPSPVVSFLYRSGSGTPTPIGSATQVGADTFELEWLLANMPADGSYTLIAILSSNGQEISRDEEAIVVNNVTESPGIDPNTAQSETVEIVDPANADTLGFYDRPGDVRYTSVIKVRHSADVVELLPYYTTSAPGTEPTWVECESGAQATADAADGVQCELTDPTTPSQVTGVAVVAYDDQTAPAPVPGPTEESGDGHRITGYEARATSMTAAGATNAVTPNTCSPAITATLFDQNGNPIGGANIDVHAQGPDDALQFDDSGNNSSAHKAPENHTTQTARDCESTATPPAEGGTQGWHAETAADRKHIESTDATGTADDGTFKFQFFSPTSGVTQYTVWSDDDGNDRLCAAEPQADGSVGWGQAPPAATGVENEDATCVRPGQSTSPSPTASTTSPSPTASSTSPTPTPTQSSASPSPTTTTPPPPVVYPSNTTIDYNGKAFTGKVKSDLKRCRRDRKTILKKQKPGKDKKVGQDTTNRRGAYKIREPKANGKYYTVAKPKSFVDNSGRPVTCAKDRSKTKKV